VSLGSAWATKENLSQDKKKKRGVNQDSWSSNPHTAKRKKNCNKEY
jgi:hypothetical protein